MKVAVLAAVDAADVGLVDVGADLEAGEIEQGHEGRRGEARGDRLALLRRHRGDDAGHRRDDARVAQLRGGEVERRRGLRPLLRGDRGGALAEIEIARRQERVRVQLPRARARSAVA